MDDRDIGSASEKPTQRSGTRFEAYGRAFDITLEPNDRLLSRLPPNRRNEIGSATPYRGTIDNQPGSWIRLTNVNGEIYGAIWDGSDFYSVVPARIAGPSMVAPLADTSGSVIFRLADTQNGLSENFCAASEYESPRGTALTEYKALITELRASTMAEASVITGEIEVAVIADSRFRQQYPTNTSAVMLSRMNVVDGIFSEQVGIIVVPTDFVVVDTPDDPFTATRASTLLQQVGEYRRTRPAISSRALAHLMTGSDLDGDTVGVAYLSSLCDSVRGVSLSEGRQGDFFAPLIIAHELGHNFGAPHDAEIGSPCAAENPNLLMAARLNGSNQFSACSLQQMQPVIAAAACILPPKIADVAVTVPSSTVEAFVNRSFDFPIDVTATGDRQVEDVQLSLAMVGSLWVESASVPGGTCNTGFFASCQLGTMAAGESRRIMLRVRGQMVGSHQSNITVTARTDRNPSNNSQSVSVTIGSSSDVAVSVEPTSISVLTNEPFDIALNVAASGVETSRNVTARLFLNDRAAVDNVLAGSGASCTSNTNFVECHLGDMQPGQQHRIVVRARMLNTYSPGINASVSAANDDHQQNNHASVAVTVNPRNDVGIEGAIDSINAITNRPFAFTASIVSRGAEAAQDVTLTTLPSGLSILQLQIEGGTCQSAGNQFSCNLGAMPAGSSRRFTAQLVGAATGIMTFHLRLRAAQDDTTHNDARSTTVFVRHPAEVTVFASPYSSSIEGRAGVLSAELRSSGHDAIQDVSVAAVLPDSFTLQGASVSGVPCASGSANSICTIPSIAAGQSAYVQIHYIATLPGDFTATVTANAAGDSDASNNTRSVNVVVRPLADVRIESAPQSLDLTPGQVVSFPVTIAADRRPVPNVTFSANLSSYLIAQSATMNGGTCNVNGVSLIHCTIGEIGAGDSRRIDITAHAAAITDLVQTSLYLSVNAGSDIDYSNNQAFSPVRIDWNGDAALTVDQASISGTAGQSFSFPTITVTATERVDAAHVEISLPAISLVVTTDGGATCSRSGASLNCPIGTLLAGASRNINLTLRADSPGNGVSTIRLRARNDRNAQNDVQTVSLTVTEPINRGGGSGGGKGGGGDLGASLACAMLALLLMRRRMRLQGTRPMTFL